MAQKIKKKRKFKFKLFLAKWSLLLLGLFIVLNFIFQIAMKPAEILSFVGLAKKKSLVGTWNSYKSDFFAHSTDTISPQFLAAMAHNESAGDPTATPQWRLRFDASLTKMFAPASSSVGLFQFTNGTYEQAKKYCVHDGHVKKNGPWWDLDSCWFNSLYLRILPSHSIEMTSAYLHQQSEELLHEHSRTSSVGLRLKRRLAAIIHLCGLSKGREFVRRNFNLDSVGSCGSHSSKHYVTRLESNMNILLRESNP